MCVLKFWAKILNKISKGVYFLVSLNDKEVYKEVYKINSFKPFEGIFLKITHIINFGNFQREVFFGTVTWVSEEKLLAENQIFKQFFIRRLLFTYLVVRGREYLLVHSYSRSSEPPFKEEGGQGEPKKTYAIKLTNFVITAHIMVGGKDGRRRTLFCGISFMKEQVSN